jgi:hypothetical protein
MAQSTCRYQLLTFCESVEAKADHAKPVAEGHDRGESEGNAPM